MNRIEIYSSKKKAGLLLIGSLAFVLCGICEFVNSEDTLYKTLSILAILFFVLGVLTSIWLLIRNRLALAIDSNGIFLYSAFGRYTSIDWKSIKGFVIQRIMINPSINTKKDFIIIELNNPEYWMEQKRNPTKRKTIQFNTNLTNSPFSISTGTLNISTEGLLDLLNKKFKEYKSNHN